MQFVQNSIVLVVASHTTIATTTVALNGILRGVKAKSPAAVDSSATLKVDITDPDGDNVYTKSGIAVNTTNKDFFDTQTNPSPMEVPVAGTYTITTTYSVAQATNRTSVVTLLVDSYL